MIIEGRKGQPKAQATRAPIIAPNTLRSKNTFRVIDALCEGPVVGLINDGQSIFFDDTPLENADGTVNFEGVTYEVKTGEPDQDPLSGFPFVEDEVSVGVEVTQPTPVVRTIEDTDIDAVRVKVRIPRLYNQSSTTGDIAASSVQFAIEYQPDGEAYRYASPHYPWASVSGTQTGTSAKGVRVTLNSAVTGLIGTKQSVTLTAQYRLVGSGTWLALGSRAVTVIIPGQQTFDGDGNTIPTTGSTTASATFEITGLTPGQYEVQATSGTVVAVYQAGFQNLTVSGKTTSPYEIEYRVNLTGSAPWNIRVTRISADTSDNPFLAQNQTFWGSYTKVIDAKLIYPDTALVGLGMDAELFGQGIPRRSYEGKWLIVNIPNNYNPETRAYNGIWDGTFDTAWTDNPAWVLYDLLINNRYGLGNDIAASSVDKYALYAIAQYCDELVDDGYGGTEPRFTFNGVINDRREAYDVINAICSCFRGMAYWGSGTITATQDAPADAIKLVTPANVVDGLFNYSGSSLKTRHTAAYVTWNDPEDGYKSTITVVEDAEGINSLGWRQIDTVAFGCTSRGQARRWGKWILDSERYETDLLTYKAGLDHADLRPGDIIKVADPAYADVRFGGRLVSTNNPPTVMTLDDSVTLSSGQTYTFAVVLTDGSIQERTITDGAGTYTSITLASALTDTPVAGAMWVITASNLAPRQFRVIAVRELEDGHQYEITALFHDPAKYARIEQDVTVETPAYSAFPSGPIASPTNLDVTEYLYQTGPSVKSAITISWTASQDARVDAYEVQYKGPSDSAFKKLDRVSGLSVDLPDTQEGSYEIAVYAIDGISNTKSQALQGAFSLLGLSAAPGDVDNFGIQILNDIAYLTWDPVTDLDLAHYRLKFAPVLSSATWGSASILLDKISKDAAGVSVQSLIGTYLIKAVDLNGNESDNAALIVTNIGNVLGLNAVAAITEGPAFSGEKENVTVLGGELQFSSSSVTSGTYYFDNDLDLGAVYTSRLTSSITATGTDFLNTVDDWAAVDDIDDWDGGDPANWNVSIQERHTSEHPALTDAEWSDYKPLVVGDYTARAFQFRSVLTARRAGVSPLVAQMGVNIDMTDRVIAQKDVICPSIGLNVTFSSPFRATPAIVVAGQNMATGNYFTITSQSASGFTIQFFNSGGSGIERTFDWTAVGYGIEG